MGILVAVLRGLDVEVVCGNRQAPEAVHLLQRSIAREGSEVSGAVEGLRELGFQGADPTRGAALVARLHPAAVVLCFAEAGGSTRKSLGVEVRLGESVAVAGP